MRGLRTVFGLLVEPDKTNPVKYNFAECSTRVVILQGIIKLSQSLLGQVRTACAEVTRRARYVHANVELIPSYAASLPLMQLKWTKVDPRDDYSSTEENIIAFILTLDSINFGSGYFPHLHKPIDAS